ncbi:hypothetical protein FA15DRAFT_711007 [Coprinopsis marcescibilis]|uniref:Uncharacterized protein n=1 Tax=Coprinopsis marcescibilis TaxID=230819 RepID=A0A5C3KBB3_COPMA|nr:hypothetical protein FA15DRAFT_711007 [Coprinopsis marcescibilis]
MSIVHVHTSTAEHVQGSLIQQVKVAKTSLASALDAVYYDGDATNVINTALVRIVELYNRDRLVKELYPTNTDKRFKIDHDLQHCILYFINTVDAVGKPLYTNKTFDAQIAGAKLVSDAVLVEMFWSQKRCNIHLAKKFADFNTPFERGDNGIKTVLGIRGEQTASMKDEFETPQRGHDHEVHVDFLKEIVGYWDRQWNVISVDVADLTLMAGLDVPFDVVEEVWPPEASEQADLDCENSPMSKVVGDTTLVLIVHPMHR